MKQILNIPQKKIYQIQYKLLQQNRPVTDQNIVKFWNDWNRQQEIIKQGLVV